MISEEDLIEVLQDAVKALEEFLDVWKKYKSSKWTPEIGAMMEKAIDRKLSALQRVAYKIAVYLYQDCSAEDVFYALFRPRR